MQSIKILSTRIDDISLEDALSVTGRLLSDGKPHQIITANSLMLLETRENENLKKIFDGASLVIPESAGVHWAAKFLGQPLKEKIPGIDFMLFLLEYARTNNRPVFFLGAKEEIIKLAAENIKKKFPGLKIAGFHSGYFAGNENAVISLINSSGAEILFAGLGIPFQEIWISKNLEKLNVKIAIGVGGSFDVMSGNLRRSPGWMIKLNIEWFFRVIQQPWRIFRIIKLFSFVLAVFKEKTGLIINKI